MQSMFPLQSTPQGFPQPMVVYVLPDHGVAGTAASSGANNDYATMPFSGLTHHPSQQLLNATSVNVLPQQQQPMLGAFSLMSAHPQLQPPPEHPQHQPPPQRSLRLRVIPPPPTLEKFTEQWRLNAYSADEGVVNNTGISNNSDGDSASATNVHAGMLSTYEQMLLRWHRHVSALCARNVNSSSRNGMPGQVDEAMENATRGMKPVFSSNSSLSSNGNYLHQSLPPSRPEVAITSQNSLDSLQNVFCCLQQWSEQCQAWWEAHFFSGAS